MLLKSKGELMPVPAPVFAPPDDAPIAFSRKGKLVLPFNGEIAPRFNPPRSLLAPVKLKGLKVADIGHTVGAEKPWNCPGCTGGVVFGVAGAIEPGTCEPPGKVVPFVQFTAPIEERLPPPV